jgi:5'-nucleotidase
MFVLISNDDGIDSPGIKALEDAARQVFEEVAVVAPLTQQSGVSHGLSLNKPLYCRRFDDHHWGLGGRPADCVFLALKRILPKRPDLVISGINLGPNMGIDTVYSGTTGAAREGLINNIMSASFSYGSVTHFDFEAVAPWTVKILQGLRRLIERGEAPMMFNVNLPSPAEHGPVKGMRACSLGHRVFADSTDEWKDPRGGQWLWLGGLRLDMQGNEDSDTHWLPQGFVTITPMLWNMYECGGRGLAEEMAETITRTSAKEQP